MLRTAKQRKSLCTECPIARAADIVGDSCSLLIVRDLLTGEKRFSELENSLSGISSRTLANKLKNLEKVKLLVRKQYKNPVRVEYSLTKKGTALRTVMNAMRSYGSKHL